MKKYIFELTITEGYDHFWDEIARNGTTGCEDVKEWVKMALEESGFNFEDYVTLKLTNFIDKA